MRTLTLVLALLVISSVAFAATETARMDVYGRGFSFIGPPLVPITTNYPNTAEIFTAIDLTSDGKVGTIYKFDAPSQGPIDFYPVDQEWSILLGEGYRVDLRTAGPARGSNGQYQPIHIDYTGVQDGVPDADGTMTDMWISLPGGQLDNPVNIGGYHWISCPFNHEIHMNVNWATDDNDGANIKLTDGNIVRTFADAMTNHLTPPASDQWCDTRMYFIDGGSQALQTLGTSYDTDDSTVMLPGHAYKLRTKVDNLAMIIPAYDPVVP